MIYDEGFQAETSVSSKAPIMPSCDAGCVRMENSDRKIVRKIEIGISDGNKGVLFVLFRPLDAYKRSQLLASSLINYGNLFIN